MKKNSLLCLVALLAALFCFSCSQIKDLTGMILPSRSLSSYPWEKVFVQVKADPGLMDTSFSSGDSFYISPTHTRIEEVDSNITSKLKSFLWANNYKVKSKEDAKYHLFFEYNQKETKRQIVFNEAKNSYDLVRYDIFLVLRVKTKDGWGNWQDAWVATATTRLGKNSIDFIDDIHNCWQVDYHLAALLRDFGRTYPDQTKWVYPQHFEELRYTADLTNEYTLENPSLLTSKPKIS
ncbi:hypothetical protein AB751O23_BA_00040 [Chlamydiales bacterium SCGC AB-751-O23]|jgi:hypothetical protein|nr:hypothetical protein AB751O23_BA_00040 [Chlamydiales bacterium SCGC AB-751-O23]